MAGELVCPAAFLLLCRCKFSSTLDITPPRRPRTTSSMDFGPCSPVFSQDSIKDFMGPLVLGYMFGTLILGMLIVQMFWYHVNFPQDSVGTRLVAWFSFALSAAFTALSAAAAWSQFGIHWGEISALITLDRSWAGFPPLSGILGLTTQAFFAWRIHQLIDNIWLSVIIVCLSILQCAMTFYLDAWALLHGFDYLTLLKMRVYLDLWLCSSLSCDLIITGAMLVILMRARHGTTFKPTLATMNQIIKFTVETGLVTSIWAIIQLVLWIKTPWQGFHLFFFMNRGRLYSTWLLSTLNSRSYISRNQRTIIDLSRAQARPATWGNLTTSDDAKLNSYDRLKAAITVKTTTETVHTDGQHEMIVVPSTPSSTST